MNGCRDIERELSAYLDGELDAATRAEVEMHLSACARCREQLVVLRKLATGVAAQPQAQPSPRFLAEVRAKIRGAEPAVEKPRWFDVVFHPVWLKVPLEAVAVVVLLFAAGMLLLPSRPQPAERVSGALAKKAEQPARKGVTVAASRNEPEPARTRSAPPLGTVVTAAPMRKDALVALGDRDQPKAAAAQAEESRRAFVAEKPASSAPASAATPVASGLVPAAEQVGKAGVESRSETAARAVQQTTATMEVAAVSVSDVQQRAETLATALGGKLLVASGNAREKIGELKMRATPVIFVELPTTQVAAFKERFLAETERGTVGHMVSFDTSAGAATVAKDKPLAMDKLGRATTTSTLGSSAALAPTPPRAPQAQQTQEGHLQYGTVAGGAVMQQREAALSASQQVETVGQALPAQEETTARTVLEIRVVLPVEPR